MQYPYAYTPSGQILPIDWSSEIAVGAASDTGRGGQESRTPFAVLPGPAMRATGGATQEAAGANGMSPSGTNGMAPAPQAAMDPRNMRSGLSVDVIDSPTSIQEAYMGSMKAMLKRNVGNYIVATFLVGTQGTTSWEGVLYDVGNDYITIYQEARNRYIVSDYYSIKFIEFYDVEGQRRCRELLDQEEGRRREGPNGMNP